MISLNDVLLAMSNIPVDDPIAEIWGRGLQGGYKIIEYTGSLPITINANGDALLDYRIYGTDGGVGERTENLFDNRTRGYYNNDNGMFVNDPSRSYWKIPVQKGDIIYANKTNEMGFGCCFYQGTYVPRSRLTPSAFPYTVPNGVDEVTNNYPAGSSAMVTVNQATPTSYIPYGYKLPMTVSDGNTEQTVHVYIGENQLDAGEYVSYGEQKIYKRTENLIPSSEAQTQTSNGVTATCDGNGVYTFTGTVGENDAYFEFSIEEFTTPNLSDTNFVISLFNTKGLSQSDTIGIGGIFYIYPANRVIKNPSSGSNKKVSKISFLFQPNRETNFTMSPMLVLGTVAPSQFAPYIVPTDPPVSLPELPTIKGETAIDYDGDPKPSQMYVKYKGKSDGA